jgi:hypothetical protein
MSLIRLRERLDHGWDFDPDNDTNDRLMMESLRLVMGTQTKVDDTRLRQRQTDMLPKLLEVLREERAKLPPLLEA